MATSRKSLVQVAKANGINTFQMKTGDILKLLLERGIEVDLPASKDLTPPKKKGFASWKPATLLATTGGPVGFRKRWVRNDPANVEKKMAEGWLLVNGTTGQPIEHEHRQHAADGKPLTSAKTYREMVLMVLPEELGKARDAYFQEQTRKQQAGIVADVERANRDAARASGSRHLAKLHGTFEIK